MKLAHRGRRAPLSNRPSCALRPAAAAISALALASLASCYTDSAGLDPPLNQLYFPTNLVVSPGGKALYVTNSDFDLQYNGGTVQVLDLEALRSAALILQGALNPEMPADIVAASEACKSLGLTSNPQTVLNPGPCSPLEIDPFVRQSATIGAFASAAVLVHDPDSAQARLFVSVRGDPSVTYFDVADDRDAQAGVVAPAGCSEKDKNPAFCLVCAQDPDRKRCGSSHRVGEDPTESIRQLSLPVEPMGITATEDGSALVTVHQTEYVASLVANYWDPPGGSDNRQSAKPYLEYYLGGLPFGPNDVVTLPEPRFLDVWDQAASYEKPLYQPGFVVSYRAAAELSILRYHSDEGASPRRPFLSRSSGVRVNVNSVGDDSRGAAVDSSERKACEAGCAEADLECLLFCATSVPLRLYVANRAPPSLIIGEVTTVLAEEEGEAGGPAKVTAAYEEASLNDVIPLSLGPSRVAIGHIIDEAGERRVRVFAVAFDTRTIFVYDPAAKRVETVIRTGRGPHALAFDTGGQGDGAFSFLYVGHFTDSYIGVVELDMRRLQTFGSMFLTVGKPVPPRESK
jgi:DNA-binding beta-propeller fold protein YncE